MRCSPVYLQLITLKGNVSTLMVSPRWILFVLSATSYGQITVSPRSLNFVQRQSGDSPYSLAVTLAGQGAISLGTCVGVACPGIITNLTSITAPAILSFSWNGYSNNSFAPGTYSASLPIVGSSGCGSTDCVVAISLTVVAYTVPTFVSPSGLFAGCSRSSPAFFDLDTCISGFVPGSTFSMPAIGSTYIDPNFGGVLRRISNAPRNNDTDSTVSGWNSNNTLVVTADFGGKCFMTDPNTGADVYSGVPCPTAWDASDPASYYYLFHSTIHKVTLRAPPSSVSDVVWYAYTNSAAQITTGGDGDTSADNWISFWADADNILGIINLNNPSQVVFANLGTLPWFHFRTCAVSKGVDAVTGKRYIIAEGTGGPSEIFSYKPGDLALVDEGTMPRKLNTVSPQRVPYAGPHCDTVTTSTTQDCYGAQHSDTVAVNGVQYYVFTYQQGQPFFQHVTFMRFNAGADLMTTAVEAGGGMTYTYPVFTGNGDVHIGCAKKAPSCVVETDSDPPITGWQVTGATNSAPITITSQPAFMGTNGDVLLINNVGGNTAANGLCTVGNLTNSSFQCVGSAGKGVYASGTGSFIRNVTPDGSNHQSEISTIDASQIGSRVFRINRLAKHRSFAISGDYLDAGGYYGQSHPNISPDGSLIVFESNNGTPDNVGVFTLINTLAAAGTGGPGVPSVSVTSPKGGLLLFGPQVTVSAMATPGAGATIASVRFRIDSNDMGTSLNVPPYQTNLDTTRLSDGPHTITAIAIDNAGNSGGSMPVSINIGNGPVQSGGGLPFITSFAPGSLRNNYGFAAGMKFTVGSSPLLVTALGRMFASGNTGVHTLRLVRAVDNTSVSGGSVDVSMPGGAPLQFKYAQLGNSVVLPANSSYGLVSSETLNGDQWYDSGAVTTASVGTVNGPAYFDGAGLAQSTAAAGSYVPVTLLYKLYVATPPTVSITPPTAGSSISGHTFSISANATSPIGLVLVGLQFKVDGVNLGAQISGSGPYSYALDTFTLTNSQHTITGIAVDSAGNIGTSLPLPIVVNNVGIVSVSITSPVSGAIATNSVIVSAAASSTGPSIATVQFQVDGVNGYASVPGPGPYSFTLDTTKLSNGSHALRAVGTDAAGTSGISNPITIIVSNSATGPFITGQVSGPARNNYTGFVGMQLMIGPSPVSVSSLGRIYVTGNNQKHTLKLVDARTSLDVPGTTVDITMVAGTVGTYQYTSLPSPVGLQPNTAYLLVSSETSGGDQWRDSGPVTGTNAATINGPVYQFHSSYILLGIPDQSYVSVNMRYCLGAVASSGLPALHSFLSDQGAGWTTNGFSGYLGMQFTTGATALTVTHLGRLFLSGNSGTHSIKLVKASNGSDVPNGAVTLSMAGGTPGTYKISALPAPVTLQPGTTYYVLSEETLGGDSWFGYGRVMSAAVATVDGPVYVSAGQYEAFGAPGYGFVPVNFYFQ